MLRPIPRDMDPPLTQNNEADEEDSDGDDSSSLSESDVAAYNDSAARCPEDFQLAWQTGKIRTGVHPDTGKPCWFCDFCKGKPRSGNNHTQAKAHVLGGRDCVKCDAIPQRWQAVFADWEKRMNVTELTKARA